MLWLCLLKFLFALNQFINSDFIICVYGAVEPLDWTNISFNRQLHTEQSFDLFSKLKDLTPILLLEPPEPVEPAVWYHQGSGRYIWTSQISDGADYYGLYM